MDEVRFPGSPDFTLQIPIHKAKEAVAEPPFRTHIHEIEQLTLSDQLAHLVWDFHFVTPPLLLWVLS